MQAILRRMWALWLIFANSNLPILIILLIYKPHLPSNGKNPWSFPYNHQSSNISAIWKVYFLLLDCLTFETYLLLDHNISATFRTFLLLQNSVSNFGSSECFCCFITLCQYYFGLFVSIFCKCRSPIIKSSNFNDVKEATFLINT